MNIKKKLLYYQKDYNMAEKIYFTNYYIRFDQQQKYL